MWPGYGDYYKSQNPGYSGPAGGYLDQTQGKNTGENTGEKNTGGGQPRTDLNQAGSGAEPPSLLKPLIYAAAAVAAFTLLT